MAGLEPARPVDAFRLIVPRLRFHATGYYSGPVPCQLDDMPFMVILRHPAAARIRASRAFAVPAAAAHIGSPDEGEAKCHQDDRHPPAEAERGERWDGYIICHEPSPVAKEPASKMERGA